MATPILYCDDGSEIELPIRWEICGCCEGHGKSSAYLGAYTQSEMDDAGPDFHDDYMAGRYDRACDDCDGTGKVARADTKQMTKAQRAAYREHVRGDREDRAIERMERMMGA